MKPLLVLTTCFISFYSFAQEQPDLNKLGRPFKLEKKTFSPLDTILSSRRKNNIPNPLLQKFTKGVLIGNNGQGQNIYVLPLDKMPCIRPDSSYRSNMPVAGAGIH